MSRGSGWIALALAPLLAVPAMASGIYAVDDSATTPAGTGQVENRVSLAGDGSILRFYPAATFRALPTVEWTVGFERDRLGDERVAGLFLQAKARLTAEPEEVGAAGVSLALASSLPFADGTGATVSGNAAVTPAAHPRLLLHANLGAVRAPGEAIALTWGLRSEATLVMERLAFHAELFGHSTGAPGLQLGVRPTLAGERANWLTLGAAVRF